MAERGHHYIRIQALHLRRTRHRNRLREFWLRSGDGARDPHLSIPPKYNKNSRVRGENMRVIIIATIVGLSGSISSRVMVARWLYWLLMLFSLIVMIVEAFVLSIKRHYFCGDDDGQSSVYFMMGSVGRIRSTATVMHRDN